MLKFAKGLSSTLLWPLWVKPAQLWLKVEVFTWWWNSLPVWLPAQCEPRCFLRWNASLPVSQTLWDLNSFLTEAEAAICRKGCCCHSCLVSRASKQVSLLRIQPPGKHTCTTYDPHSTLWQGTGEASGWFCALNKYGGACAHEWVVVVSKQSKALCWMQV